MTNHELNPGNTGWDALQSYDLELPYCTIDQLLDLEEGNYQKGRRGTAVP